ncbi:FAD binding domain-containing protein [Stachybotrys elegans]|uniref:FAD binding domain-containing protein n=1 Tax=Stachybotrys elegans TaxID=80388 RepID=A0A8K0WUK7_9HYPO|nr:FAD binding domain-containing protein [Stachybotrys elegans]
MLHIIVVGGGIAGLSAAISLRRVGHTVHIYERSPMLSEVGAAISVPPNATRLLVAWGLDPKRWRFVQARSFTYLDHLTLETTAVLCKEDTWRAAGGADSYHAHRVDLQESLKWLATREDGPGTPVTIHTSSHVVAYNSEKPSITLRSGQELCADLIIGADGVHSLATEAVLGHRNAPVPPAHSNWCFRFLIPANELESDPETKGWNDNCDGRLNIIAHNESRRRIVAYTCRDNTVHNFAAIYFDDKESVPDTEDWQKTADISQVLSLYEGFNPRLLKIMSKATSVKRWPLLYRKPVKKWHKDFLVLTGDAAHPMLPHQGQAGAMALEDGLTLGLVLNGATRANMQDRLQIYTDIRRGRTSVMQILSNAGQDEAHLIRKDLMQFLADSQIPDTPAKMQIYSFAYDAVRETLTAMKAYDEGFELPSDYFESEVIPGPNL